VRGAESYEHKKTFSSINRSVLSAYAVQESGMSPSLRNCASDIKNDDFEYMYIFIDKYSCGSSLCRDAHIWLEKKYNMHIFNTE
jgi:hypothetical protein